MKKYLVKQLRNAPILVSTDPDVFDYGPVIGYEVLYKTNSQALPRGFNDHIFVEGVDTIAPKVDVDAITGALSIIEDSVKVIVENAKTAGKHARKDAIEVLTTVGATTIANLKPIIQSLIDRLKDIE